MEHGLQSLVTAAKSVVNRGRKSTFAFRPCADLYDFAAQLLRASGCSGPVTLLKSQQKEMIVAELHRIINGLRGVLQEGLLSHSGKVPTARAEGTLRRGLAGYYAYIYACGLKFCLI